MQRVPWLTPTVTSAPFRAEYEIQVQRPLDGGGSETWQSTTLVPTDSSGRIRHERHDYVPASFANEPPDNASNQSTLRWALLMPSGRRFGIFALLAALTFPSYAAKRLTIGQLEQTLKSAAAAHKTDIEIAQEIGQIKLSERISSEELEQLGREASKGPRTGLALQLLSDVSSFLPLPASELPAIPSPDQPTQERQLEAMRKYALGMLPRLPNLLATRTTYSFDDSAQAQVEGSWPERAGLHLVGTSKTEVSVLSERENLLVKESGTLRAKNGLVTWGEFGSVLQLIIIDSANGTTTWNHWEQTATGLVSVFDYSVPRSASHYQIATPLSETRGPGAPGAGRLAAAWVQRTKSPHLGYCAQRLRTTERCGSIRPTGQSSVSLLSPI